MRIVVIVSARHSCLSQGPIVSQGALVHYNTNHLRSCSMSATLLEVNPKLQLEADIGADTGANGHTLATIKELKTRHGMAEFANLI